MYLKLTPEPLSDTEHRCK